MWGESWNVCGNDSVCALGQDTMWPTQIRGEAFVLFWFLDFQITGSPASWILNRFFGGGVVFGLRYVQVLFVLHARSLLVRQTQGANAASRRMGENQPDAWGHNGCFARVSSLISSFWILEFQISRRLRQRTIYTFSKIGSAKPYMDFNKLKPYIDSAN